MTGCTLIAEPPVEAFTANPLADETTEQEVVAHRDYVLPGQPSSLDVRLPLVPVDYEYWRSAALFWIASNPGKDAVDVARHFGLDLKMAVDIVNELSAMGLLRNAG